jgi:hypothetical protein
MNNDPPQTYLDILVEMDDAVLDDLLQLLFRYTESGLDFLQSVHKVVAIDLELVYVVGDTGLRSHLKTQREIWITFPASSFRFFNVYLDMSVERKTRGALDETSDFGAAKVLGQSGQLVDVDVVLHSVVGHHLGGVDFEDLDSPRVVG